MKKLTLVLICVVTMCGGWGPCGPKGNTGSVRRYATGMRGCGDARTYAEVWYTDFDGNPVDIEDMRLARVGDYGQMWYDNYAIDHGPQGFCGNVRLEGSGLTGKGGKTRINGRAPGRCDGHPGNWRHDAHGRWGCDVMSMAVGYMVGHPPPGAPVWMYPNSSCPVTPDDFVPPTVPTAKGPVSTAAHAAVSGSASTAMMTMAIVEKPDPNDPPQSPPNGLEYSLNLIRVYDDHAEVRTKIGPSNNNDWETFYRFGTPVRYEAIVYTSDAQEGCVGQEFVAYVQSDVLPEGIEVACTVVASDDDEDVFIILSDAFYPVDIDTYVDLMNDPNEKVRFDEWTPLSPEEQPFYDPNFWEDPNDCRGWILDTSHPDFMNRHDPNRVIPMTPLPLNDIDEIRIEPVIGTPEIGFFLTKWLTEDYTFGGSDGFVDMRDWASFFNY